MPTAAIEGYHIVQTWGDEKKTTIETKLVYKPYFGFFVEIGSSLTQVPEEAWPLVRDRINQLFREARKQREGK